MLLQAGSVSDWGKELAGLDFRCAEDQEIRRSFVSSGGLSGNGTSRRCCEREVFSEMLALNLVSLQRARKKRRGQSSSGNRACQDNSY